MKRFIYEAVLGTVLACSYGHAQTHEASANIPFEFRMGESVMPAGKYLIHEGGGVLTLREERGKSAASRLTLPVSRAKINENPSLEFTRYGNEYYLTKLWSANSQEGRAVMQSKREKELAKTFRTPGVAAVLQAQSK
jgi:hypothetical protein